MNLHASFRTAGLCGVLITLLVIAWVMTGSSPEEEFTPTAETAEAAPEQSNANALAARVAVQQIVERRLKSPASAKYAGLLNTIPSAHATPLGDNRYRVRSWVDAQNVFGALLRNHFEFVVVDQGNDTFVVESESWQKQ